MACHCLDGLRIRASSTYKISHKVCAKYSLTDKSNFCPSRGRTVWSKEENGKKSRNWYLQTSALGRMSSNALPAVIQEVGKSLIPKPW